MQPNLKILRIAALLILATCSTLMHANEVVLPAVDGMVIDTKDSVLQQVRIRLKSFGPGFCGVRIIFAGKVSKFSAPPLKWSDWLNIGPAVSGGAYDLDFTPECATGALGEVKFIK